MRLKLWFENVETGDPTELDAQTQADVLISQATFTAAHLIDAELRAGMLKGDALVGMHVAAWARKFEDELLETLSTALDRKDAKALLVARGPRVEMHEAVRDKTGKLLGTVKRMISDPAAAGS